MVKYCLQDGMNLSMVGLRLVRFEAVNPATLLSLACSFRSVRRRHSRAGAPHLRGPNLTLQCYTCETAAQRTVDIHASLHSRDGFPIPLDRRDLRMLERT
jgi:hypothetical protein